MKKSQQYYIFKLSSKRIKKANYNIELTLKQARKNAELISISRNQVVTSIFRINNIEFNQKYIDDLFAKRKKLKKSKSTENNISKLIEIEGEINKTLFIPELISVSIDNKKHYDDIIKTGLVVNGEEYVRLLCGSGHSRRNTVIFCAKKIEKELKSILNNGRKIPDMVLAKNNAYFALSYSGNLPVSEPYFCVIPDCEVKRIERVDFIGDHHHLEEQDIELDFNLFDGQGIISPKMAQKWANDLEIDDYIPSSFIIRNSFLKGMVCVIDFHKYSDNIGKHIIKDVWGNDVNVRDMDLILTESQFKAWSSYDSCNDYRDNCRKNGFDFGVVRAAPKRDAKHVFTNYQYLQILDLDDNDVRNLCRKTIDYFSNVINKDARYTLLYLLGKMAYGDYDKNIYDKIGDNVAKALILNNNLINDPYIKNHVYRSLNKKIKKSYIGNLLVDGNYSFIVQDPYAFMQYIFNEPIDGLLKRDEYYSGFWNAQGVEKIAAMRSPLTWRSEGNVLDLAKTKQTEEWYKYLQAGVTIHNIHGNDMMLYADADADGDIIMTTNQKEFIDCIYGGLPVSYKKSVAEKKKVIEDDLWEVDKLSFDTKIGYITNCSTTLYAMEAEHRNNPEKHNEIIRRLKLCRKQQGNQIDSAKGIAVEPFPQHWVKWQKITENMSESEVKRAEFNNSIVIDKRPYFFRYLYSDHNKKYKNFNNSYNNYCVTNLGKSLEDVLRNPETEKEVEIRDNYYQYSPLLDSDCTMNKISHYMEENVKMIKRDMNVVPTSENIMLLKTRSIPLDKEKLKKLYTIYKTYKSNKRNFGNMRDERGEAIYKTLEQYSNYIRKEAYEISSNIQELANLAVTICYETHPSDSKAFAWNVFGEGIIRNIEENRQSVCTVPFLDDKGEIEYLGHRYSSMEIDILDVKDYDEDNF